MFIDVNVIKYTRWLRKELCHHTEGLQVPFSLKGYFLSSAMKYKVIESTYHVH